MNNKHIDIFIKNKCDEISTDYLQMYVNYYDTVVKYTLPEENKTILASKYQLYLPSEKELIEELHRELKEIEIVEGN